MLHYTPISADPGMMYTPPQMCWVENDRRPNEGTMVECPSNIPTTTIVPITPNQGIITPSGVIPDMAFNSHNWPSNNVIKKDGKSFLKATIDGRNYLIPVYPTN